MNPITFRSPDSPTVLYACGACGRLHSPEIFAGRDTDAARKMAEQCCVPRPCPGCGALPQSPHLKCAGCRDADARSRLESLPVVDDHQGPVYDPGTERYFASLDDFLDEPTGSRRLHPCTVQLVSLDLGPALDDAAENYALDDMHWDWEGLDELQAAVDEFNAAQRQEVWTPDTSRVCLDNPGVGRARSDRVVAFNWRWEDGHGLDALRQAVEEDT